MKAITGIVKKSIFCFLNAINRQRPARIRKAINITFLLLICVKCVNCFFKLYDKRRDIIIIR